MPLISQTFAHYSNYAISDKKLENELFLTNILFLNMSMLFQCCHSLQQNSLASHSSDFSNYTTKFLIFKVWFYFLNLHIQQHFLIIIIIICFRLYPEYYQAMNNLANLLKNKKQFSEAESYLRKAIYHKYLFTFVVNFLFQFNIKFSFL